MLVARPDADRYWLLVRRTAQALGEPVARVDALERDIRAAQPDEQELFYHNEALTVVSDLYGLQPSAQDEASYKQLRQSVFNLP